MPRSSRLLVVFVALLVACGACTAAGASARGLPSPSPRSVRASGTVSVFPVPGTKVASPETTISFRGLDPGTIGDVVVTGSVSGAHDGKFLDHSDGTGASFVPAQPFTAGETVRVQTHLAIRDAKKGAFSFTIATPAHGFDTNTAPKTKTAASPFVSRPDLVPPTVTVNQSSTPNTGGILLTPNPTLGQATTSQSGPLIVDPQGNVVWFDPHAPGTALDLSVQQYQGRPVLSWFEGTVTSGGYGDGDFVLYDDTYRKVAEVDAGNGYQADLHDFQITPRNTALLIAYNPILAPAKVIGRKYDRVVIDAVVQEIDIATGAVLFEWHSVGNVDLGESYVPLPDKLAEPYDYVHPNSVALDGDGNIWLSARHTSTIYKIDRVTGALYWRLGGKQTNFDMGKGTTFMWQHDVRPHGDGSVTLFDNAASAPGVADRTTSRALFLNVDEKNLKVRYQRDDESPQRALALSQGDAQSLPNGDMFVGWGAVPEYTQFGPFGAVKLDATINGGSASYRAYRFNWIGRPSAPPTIVRKGDTIYASWNGATQVASWRVGNQTFARTGFETAMAVGGGATQVQALDPARHVLATTNLRE
jgi:Arylsulfotransferase (ASST)